MAVLFRYELKKLLSRKLVWLAVALCAAYTVYINWGMLAQLWSGYVQGEKDIYAIYEGRVVTDAFKQEVKNALVQYAENHPSHVRRNESPDGSVDYESTSMLFDYYTGVCAAFQEIGGMTSIEDTEKYQQMAKEALTSGKDYDGSPLLNFRRSQYEESLKYSPATLVIHYNLGWQNNYYIDLSATGPIMIGLLAIAVLPLFGRERSSRMEGILLCSPKRNRAAVAKMLAAALCAGALVLLFFGLELFISGVTFGLDGAFTPAQYMQSISCAGAFAFALLTTILAAAACASLIALAAALTRNTLLALLIAAAFLAVQILVSTAIQNGISEWMFKWINNRALEPPWYYGFQEYVGMLPVNAMLHHYNMGYEYVRAAFALGFPAALSALLFWLAPRQFLKRRKV